MHADIAETGPREDTLVYGALPDIGYRDGFEVHYPSVTFANVDDYARRYFLAQPPWLSLLSMHLGSREKIARALDDGGLRLGTSVGGWTIHLRDESEIVFGQDMGFMEYRFGMRWVDPASTFVSTVCQFKGRTGAAYFAVVKHFHRPFVRYSLGLVQ